MVFMVCGGGAACANAIEMLSEDICSNAIESKKDWLRVDNGLQWLV